MKYVFFGAFAVMGLCSVVALTWTPRPADPRAEGLDFFLTHAVQPKVQHVVTWEDAETLFTRLDASGDDLLDEDDWALTASGDPDRLSFLLDAADDDGDRRVSRSELRAFFTYLDRNRDDVLTLEDRPEAPPIELIWCSDDNPVRREQIRLFNRYHPDYRLRLDPHNAGMDKIIVQSLAGVGPDLFDCYSGYQLSAYVRAGVALDLTDALEKSNLSSDEIWPSLHPLILHEDRVYGAINNAGAQAVWYNKRIFDETGLPYPAGDWTWDDCIDICRALTVRNARGQITRYGLIGFWDWKLGLFQHGADFFTPEGTRCTLDSPEAAAAMQFMQDLIYKHEVMPTPQAEAAIASAGGWGTGVITLFGAERGAMAIGGRWWLCILRDPSYAHLDLGAVEIPALRLPDGRLSRRNYGYGRSTLINAAGPNIEGALLFIRFLFSPEWSALINRQADALGPVVRYNYTDDFMFNPAFPAEDFNAVWRSAMETTEAEQVSPYINGQTVDRILWKQTDLVRGNQKSGADAMRDAARRINEEIIETLARDARLRDKYYQALARGAEPAWEPGARLPWGAAP